MDISTAEQKMSKRPIKYQIHSCGISDIGMVRENNEDAWGELPEQGFFILADGMGGHQAGEVASRETVTTLCRLLKRNFRNKLFPFDETMELLKAVIKTVNTHVYKLGRSNVELKGMGTTLCLLHIHKDGVIFAHVGDSRIYRLRSGKIKLLTQDHSLLRELVDLGQIEEEQARDFHYKNIITRAIGTEPLVEPTVVGDTLSSKDLYLLCSDGLSDLLTPQEIETTIKKANSLCQAASDLVVQTKKKGGHDNVTVVIVEVNRHDA